MAIRGDLGKLAAEMRANSKRWFPEMHADPIIPLWLFYSIGVSSEGGEQLDESKKVVRYASDPDDPSLLKLELELADVFTYLLLLCDELDIDIIDAYEAKRDQNEERFA